MSGIVPGIESQITSTVTGLESTVFGGASINTITPPSSIGAAGGSVTTPNMTFIVIVVAFVLGITKLLRIW